jgi:hypothetical protein
MGTFFDEASVFQFADALFIFMEAAVMRELCGRQELGH